MSRSRPVSAMLTSLPMEFVAAVRQASALGFTHVDVVALAERPAEHFEVLAECGVLVACAAVGRGLPDGHTLDAAAPDVRRAALEAMKRQIADAARLGVMCCYVVPGHDATAAGLERFAEACGLLADFAASRMIRLCVEHIPGRALATARGTLAWLELVNHINLALLLDVGHCLISGEDAAAVITHAGPRLGYVHFDDNDGVGDLHWPLLAGKLTRDALRRVNAALDAVGYHDAVALELSPDNPDPVAALAHGKRELE